jgi:hypothetical protein
MGQGMLLITPEPDAAIAVAARHGIAARRIGEITSQAGIRLQSQGYFSTGTSPLTYNFQA